jgi:predicted acetyltransferase
MIEIRTIVADELEAFCTALETAFSSTLKPEDLEMVRLVAETDRMHAAFEDGRIVGGADSATFAVTVPGGAHVPAAGVTGVGVLPTHRRRGINTALMRAQLDEVHRREEPLALLFASEGGIYGRFGYGLASFTGKVDLQVERSAFVRGYRPKGRVRLLDREAALPLMRPVYDAMQAERPGMIRVDDRWWQWLFFQRKKDDPMFFALHDTDGEVDAFAAYRVKHEWPSGVPKNELSVERLVATTPQAWADMWRYLFDIDLVDRVVAWGRPVDEPLLRLMQEPRRLQFALHDALYARLVDVQAALSARGYEGTGRIVIEVDDPFCAWNTGRVCVETANGAAACTRVTDAPDLMCSVTDLGAIYLGGATFRQLHRAGRVEEAAPGALARADALFASDPAPWCAVDF